MTTTDILPGIENEPSEPPVYPEDNGRSEPCPFCAERAHHGACAELIAFTERVKVGRPQVPSLIVDLPNYRARIAELRAIKCDLTASILRDEVLAQLEAWLDPTGAACTKELQRIQGKAALALALERVDYAPF